MRTKRITVLALVLLGALGGSALGGDRTKPKDRIAHGLCLPASVWDGSEQAPDSQRPCVQVTRVYEDGSFKARVLDRNGTVRYSLGVGNPQS